MKVLVINVYEKIYKELAEIYTNKQVTLISDPKISEAKLIDAIKNHDRIVIVGDGDEKGIYNPYFFSNPFKYRPYLLTYHHLPLFKDKEVIAFWFGSDAFFKGQNINGVFGKKVLVKNNDLGWVDFSKLEYAFLESFRQEINKTLFLPLSKVKDKLVEHNSEDNEAANFNLKNITYYFKSKEEEN